MGEIVTVDRVTWLAQWLTAAVRRHAESWPAASPVEPASNQFWQGRYQQWEGNLPRTLKHTKNPGKYDSVYPCFQVFVWLQIADWHQGTVLVDIIKLSKKMESLYVAEAEQRPFHYVIIAINNERWWKTDPRDKNKTIQSIIIVRGACREAIRPDKKTNGSYVELGQSSFLPP